MLIMKNFKPHLLPHTNELDAVEATVVLVSNLGGAWNVYVMSPVAVGMTTHGSPNENNGLIDIVSAPDKPTWEAVNPFREATRALFRLAAAASMRRLHWWIDDRRSLTLTGFTAN